MNVVLSNEEKDRLHTTVGQSLNATRLFQAVNAILIQRVEEWQKNLADQKMQEAQLKYPETVTLGTQLLGTFQHGNVGNVSQSFIGSSDAPRKRASGSLSNNRSVDPSIVDPSIISASRYAVTITFKDGLFEQEVLAQSPWNARELALQEARMAGPGPQFTGLVLSASAKLVK